MKKSKSPSVRINRVAKELKESNRYQIGNVLFEQIISIGVNAMEEELEKAEKDGEAKRWIISPNLYKETIKVIKSHLEQI
tara:strand:- start:58 stop:297 length:240 start_codon:yes stop_codon:yes gene_type:complete